jgi:hypothetical protein
MVQLEKIYDEYEDLLKEKYGIVPPKKAKGTAKKADSAEEEPPEEAPAVSSAREKSRQREFHHHLCRVLEWCVNEVGTFRPLDLYAPLDDDDEPVFSSLKDACGWREEIGKPKAPRKP